MINYLGVLSFFLSMGTVWASRGLDFGSRAKTAFLVDKAIVRTSENLPIGSRAKTAFLVDKAIVITSENLPISGVVVSKNGDNIFKSNKNGFFKIKKGVLEIDDVIRFEHPNFVTTTKVLRSDSKLIIWMKKRGDKTVFGSRRGHTISFGKGGRLKIPKDAFSLNGQPYTGAVEIRTSYINVTNRNEVRAAPGRYIAKDERSNGLVPLSSFGMIEITAVVPRKNVPLELRKGRAITASFPILTENTPDRVNLYEFNTEIGFWILKGSLQNVQNTLQGLITSVNSAWNADDPCSEALVCVKVEVHFANGNPGCGVGATGVTYQGFDGIYSIGPDNYVELMVCPNLIFELGACWLLCCGPGVPASDPCCNNPQYHTNIDMSTITLDPTGCTDIGHWLVPN